jgi:hypothetical protein
MPFGRRPHAVVCEDYLRPKSSEHGGPRWTSADHKATISLLRAGFLDERGVRWTPWIS